jgi:hypothetical protein
LQRIYAYNYYTGKCDVNLLKMMGIYIGGWGGGGGYEGYYCFKFTPTKTPKHTFTLLLLL